LDLKSRLEDKEGVQQRRSTSDSLIVIVYSRKKNW